MRRAFSLLAFLSVCAVLTFATQMPDFDLWSRLQVGSIVWQLGHPLMKDVFAYVPTKPVWVDHEWGAGVVFFAFVRAFGNTGIFVVKGLLLLATFAAVVKATVVSTGKRPGLLWLALLSVAIFPGVGSLVRSQAFTYAFFALWLWALESMRRGRTGVLWVFPVSMAAWANLHGGFLAGLGLVGLYVVGEALNRRSVRPYALALAMSVPVTLLTPYEWSLWRYMAEAATMPRPLVGEWAAMGWHSWHRFPGVTALAVLVLVGGAVALVRRPRADWTRVVVLVALAALALRHQRHVVFFALAVAALAFGAVDELLDPARARLSPRARRAAGAILSSAVLTVVLLLTWPHLSGRLDVRPSAYPTGSVEFIRVNGIAGNLAVPFDWGSFASWSLYPQNRVLVDGRYEEVYPPEVFESAADFSLRREGWRAALQRYRPDVIILPKRVYPPETMRELLDWRPVYEDLVSVVLVPAGKEPKEPVWPDFRGARVALGKATVAIYKP